MPEPEAESADVFPVAEASVMAGLLEELPDLVVVLDAEGRVRWGNRAAERFFGRRLEESVGISALDFVHSDDAELVLRSLTSVQEKELGTLIEVRVASPEGWRLLELRGRAVPQFGQGNILFCLRDATDRRRWEVARDDDAKFRSLVQNAASITMLVDADGTVESVSAALTRLFGHDPEAVEGRPLVELFATDSRDAVRQGLEQASSDGHQPVTIQADCLRYQTDELVAVEAVIVSLLDDPTVRGLVVSLRDVSDRAAAEQELRQALSLLTATLEATTDGIVVLDIDGRIVSYNQRFVALWQVPEDVLVARDDAPSLAFVVEQLAEPEAFLARVEGLSSAPEADSFDTIASLDGRIFEVYSKPQRIAETVAGRVWSFRDVTEHKRLEESLSHRAFHDSLTGLANQALFLEVLDRAVAATGRGAILAVLFIDVDGLKSVNDRFGHMAGDQLLVKVAEVLRAGVRESDTVARLGGDEFGILADNLTHREDATVLAERILAGLSGSFMLDDLSVDVSLSVGIAYNELGLSYLDVLRHADSAMYSAKLHGKGRWVVYSAEPTAP